MYVRPTCSNCGTHHKLDGLENAFHVIAHIPSFVQEVVWGTHYGRKSIWNSQIRKGGQQMSQKIVNEVERASKNISDQRKTSDDEGCSSDKSCCMDQGCCKDKSCCLDSGSSLGHGNTHTLENCAGDCKHDLGCCDDQGCCGDRGDRDIKNTQDQKNGHTLSFETEEMLTSRIRGIDPTLI